MPVTQLRNWCFTVHDWTDAELNRILAVHPLVRYVIVGEEKTKKGGPHLQGYAQLDEKCSFAKLKKAWELDRMHIEVCKGTAAQNIDYCSKEGKIHTAGECKHAGARSSFSKARDLVAAGASMAKVIAEAGESYQVCRGAELAMKYCEPRRDGKAEVVWIWGPGSKKKLLMSEIAKLDSDFRVSWKVDGKLWWSYDREEILVIRSGDHWELDDVEKLPLRALFSSIPYAVETKGAQRQMVAKHIFVMTDDAPPQWCRKKINNIISVLPSLGIRGSGGNTKPQTGNKWTATRRASAEIGEVRRASAGIGEVRRASAPPREASAGE